MNQTLLKSFAPAARIKFREAMIQRAKLLGLSATGECVPAQAVGSNVIVAGYSMPASWEEQRQKLKDRIKKDGWDKVIDEAAYTWFNRLSALRYMEVHAFIPQRVRVLTSATGEFAPEILDKAASLDFPSFKKSEMKSSKWTVRRMKNCTAACSCGVRGDCTRDSASSRRWAKRSNSATGQPLA